MKKSLLILLSLFCIKGFSQSSISLTNVTASLNVPANSIVPATTTIQATTTLDFDIKNTSSSTQSYKVKRYDIALHIAPATPDTASAYFCFAGGCYPASIKTSPSSLTLTPGQSASSFTTGAQMLTTDLIEASTVGYSLVKYSVINTANASDSIQFSIKYNGPLGVSELNTNSLSSFELFPNPATDVALLKVNSQKAMDVKVIVFNALGSIVSEKPVAIVEGKNKIEINVSDLSSGVYFAQIKMANGALTKKLVVK